VVLALVAIVLIAAGSYVAGVYPFHSNAQGPGILLIMAPALVAALVGLGLLIIASWSLITGRSLTRRG
jgi:hypothetical protein